MPGEEGLEQKKSDHPYIPTERERAAIQKVVARTNAKKIPRFKKTDGKPAEIELDHPKRGLGHVLLMETLGIDNFDFLDGLISQVTAGSQGPDADAREANFILSVIKGIEPKDQIEIMLAAQMAMVHMATMTFARRLANVEVIQQQDSAERAFNKLVRTFAAQMEALKRYRTGGEQKVTVQHVSVGGSRRRLLTTSPNLRRSSEKATPASPALTDTGTVR